MYVHRRPDAFAYYDEDMRLVVEPGAVESWSAPSRPLRVASELDGPGTRDRAERPAPDHGARVVTQTLPAADVSRSRGLRTRAARAVRARVAARRIPAQLHEAGRLRAGTSSRAGRSSSWSTTTARCARFPQRVPPPRRTARHRGRAAPTRASCAATTAGRTRSTARCARRATSATTRSTSTSSRCSTVRVDEWRGLVFVNLDEPTCRRWPTTTARSSPRSRTNRSNRSSTTTGSVHDVATNWKVYCDNYGEGYHVPLVHPELNRESRGQGVPRRGRRPLLRAFRAGPCRRDQRRACGCGAIPNLALNVYPTRMNIERFVPAGAAHDARACTTTSSPTSTTRERRRRAHRRRDPRRGPRRSARPCQRNLANDRRASPPRDGSPLHSGASQP